MSKIKNHTVAETETVAAESTPETVAPVVETAAPATPVFVIEEAEIVKKVGRSSTLTYPIAQLVPGTKQSFFVPAIDADAKKKAGTSVRTFAGRNGLKVIVRDVEGGVRVWRAAENA